MMENKYLEALVNVIDPELNIDIVNLGLIKKIDIHSDGFCIVTMTLTIMGCPMSEYLFKEIREQLIGFSEVKDVDVKLVWHPQWTIKDMSREARYQLGIH